MDFGSENPLHSDAGAAGEVGVPAASGGYVQAGLPPGYGWGSHRIADPAKPPRSLDTASWFAVAGLALIGLANLMRVLSAAGLHGGVDPASAAELSRLPSLHRTYATWSGLALFAELLAAAMFIPWFARAYANLRKLGVQHLRWSDGWAIGAWFVPFLNLVRPKQIADDIWRGSEPGVDVNSERWRLGSVTALAHWWWALFILGGLAVAIGSGMADSGYSNLIRAVEFGLEREASLARIENGTLIDIVGSAGLVVSALLGAIFVRRVTKRFETIRRQLILAGPVQAAVAVPVAVSSAGPGPGLDSAHVPPPLQDLIRCPECAEFVLPAGACRYCGYSFSANR